MNAIIDDTKPSLLAMAAAGAAGTLDTERVNRLIAALRAAREKLQLYRNKAGGEYVGGMEFGALISRIDTALADCGCAEQLGDAANAP